MQEKIEEIEARLKAATPGPWNAVGNSWNVSSVYEPSSFGFTVAKCLFMGDEDDEEAGSNHDANAEFIANAPSDIAYLLAEVKRLERAAADLDMVYRRMVAVSQPDRYAFPDCD